MDKTARIQAAERIACGSVLSFRDAYWLLVQLNDNEEALRVGLEYLAVTGRADALQYLISVTPPPCQPT